MKLSLGFSPCPNDTFIFDALIHQKIDTEGLSFQVHLADVSALNQGAFEQSLDITKLSYHALGHVVPNYQLLRAGSALGNNCGPLLIAKKYFEWSDIPSLKIAIPGRFTTANFLLSIAQPEATQKQAMLFSEVEEAVLTEKVEAGLIIHENRFTYQDKGLVKLIDLGEYWEKMTQKPIPLGGIAIKRTLPADIKEKVDRLIRKSVQFAFENPKESEKYVQQHAQEMSLNVIEQHIQLYVNKYSIDLGREGEQAITSLFEMAIAKKIIPTFTEALFV